MSTKKTGIAAAIAAGAILTAPAFGGGTPPPSEWGLSYEIVGTDLLADVLEPNWTVRIYADMMAGGQLNAVAGNSVTLKTISTSDLFFQEASGGPTSQAINSAFFGFVPNLEWDSYVTIGCLHADGFPFSSNNLNDVGMDWTTFENGGTLSADNGSWFAVPGDEQCNATLHTPDGCDAQAVPGVLVAQLTILGGIGSSCTVEALFQGREADGATNWQINDSITVTLTEAGADCNNNGVDDACDIENGDSQDDNNDGIPDECADCNNNGTPDVDDILDGTSNDCNGNNIPDECDVDSGSSNDCDNDGVPDECQGDDCDGNGVPDSCDIAGGAADCNNNGILDSCDLDNGGADCNGNNILDSCDIANGSSEDCDGDGTPDDCEADSDGDGTIDDCEYTAYLNVDTGATYDTWANAIGDAQDGDRIEGDFEAVNAETLTDFNGRDIRVTVVGGDMDQPAGALLNMSDGGHLEAGTAASFAGRVRSSGSGHSMIGATSSMSFTGDVTVRSGSDLELDAASISLAGDTTVRDGGDLDMSFSTAVENSGSMQAYGDSAIYADNLLNTGGMSTSGHLFMDLDNAGTGEIDCNATTVLTGDLNNDGDINVHVGTFYALGDVINNGTIIGDFDNDAGMRDDGPASGDGFTVVGDFVAGADASLNMPHENWMMSVGGNFDVAINSSANYNMDLATLRLFATSDGLSTLEAMSQDIGETLDGLDGAPEGHFPIGTLVIASGESVQVVDSRDNTGTADEVVYVGTLVGDAGATFDANGVTVWAGEIINNGVILGDVDVIDPTPPCEGDYNSDGIVNIDDLLLTINFWGPDADFGDGDGDGDADIDDLLIVISNWGVCGG